MKLSLFLHDFHQAIHKKKIIRHRITRRGRAAEKLDTMMAKVQRRLNLTPEKVRCRRPCGEVGRVVSFDNADRLPVVVRFPAGPQVSLKVGDQPKGRWRRPKKT